MYRFLVLLAPAVASCAEPARPNPAMVRDSAGIRIVENTGPLWEDGGGWRLGDQPLVDIGELEGDEEYELAQVGGALRLRAGGIVILNGATAELRFYDKDGRYVTKAGGEGGGPGEFSNGFGMSLWAWPGDSVAVWDLRPRRLSVYDATGRMAREVSFKSSERLFPRPIGFFASGRLAAYEFAETFARPGPIGSVSRDTMQYASYALEEDVATDIVELPGSRRWTTRWQGRPMTAPLPFHPSAVTAVAGDRLYYSAAEEHEILAYGENGELYQIIRQMVEPRILSPEDIDAYVEERMENAPSEQDGRQAWLRFLGDMPWPDVLPAYRELKTDRQGALWARVFNRFGDETPRWYVFDGEGVWLGTVVLPDRFDLYDIGDDYVLGRWRDDLDVEHVRLYALIKPER